MAEIKNMITIKQAEKEDIPVIEDILLDVVNWLDSANKQMWIKSQITWEYLSTRFTINEFCIAYINNNPVGSMALIDYDPLF